MLVSVILGRSEAKAENPVDCAQRNSATSNKRRIAA
jgi:hypothetical protein